MSIFNKKRIGLFPLEVVLFPESMLPIYVFERKYINLINKTIATDGQFGINLSYAYKFYNIGCTASILDIKHHQDEDTYDILVIGKQRYKIVDYKESSEKYNIGEIEIIDDDVETIDYSILDKCIEIYNKITEEIKITKIEKIDYGKLSVQYPSYYIAQKSGLTLAQRQKLLETTSENKRLLIIQKHLESMLPMIKEAEFITQLVRNDGYYIPKIDNI